MGDRANVHVAGVYLYTHWGGYNLPETVRAALIRAQEGDRWQDDPYLARIIFCEMVTGSEKGTTGYGISATCGDGAERVLIVDTRSQQVGFGSAHEGGGPRKGPAPWVSFTDYIAARQAWPTREG
jgi:hypothetical protein